jgi:hypothetical protein
MLPFVQLRQELEASVAAADGKAADRLCVACVELLNVDGAPISLWRDRGTWGTFGSSSETSRRLDEFQFTFGEGPCLDAMTHASPVLEADLSQTPGERWPAFTGAVLEMGVRGVFAMPVTLQGTSVGALDLYRRQAGTLDDEQLRGGLLAAEIAGRPVRDLMTRSATWRADDGEPPADELILLGRVAVAQATGMIMGQVDVDRGKLWRGYGPTRSRTI